MSDFDRTSTVALLLTITVHEDGYALSIFNAAAINILNDTRQYEFDLL